MKKIIISLSVISSLFMTAYALPIGNPCEASLFQDENECCEGSSWCDCFNFGIGFYGDYVYNRHMRTVAHKDVDTVELFTNAAYLVVNFADLVDVFSTLGVSRLSINTRLAAFSPVPADLSPIFELQSAPSFSYSVGARTTICEYGCFSLGVMGQYFATRPDTHRIGTFAGNTANPGSFIRNHYSEWQIGTGVSYRYNDLFVPYIAARYAESKWTFNRNGITTPVEDGSVILHNMRSQRNFGYSIGLTLAPLLCQELSVTAEARFLDEKAFYINAQMRF